MRANRVKSVTSSGQELRCPICLDVYTAPKILPCLHTYCQHCLHKYIVNSVPKGKTGATFICPECRKETFPPLPDIPLDTWAEHYPYNTVLLSVLPPEKRKMDRYCDSCPYEGNSSRAISYCTTCKEALCLACDNLHKRNKVLRDHTVVNIHGLYTDPKLAVNLSVCVTCPEHVNKDFEFYCKSHRSMCCSECFYKVHRGCVDVFQLKNCSDKLLKEKEANTVADRLKQLKVQLDQFKNENEGSFKKTEAELNDLTDAIDVVRNKINTLLDNIKAKITLEKNALLKEESIVRHEENQQCEAISSTITNSLYLWETVLTHGNPLHVLTTLNKTEEQLVIMESALKEKYCEVRHIDAKLCLDDRLLSLINNSETNIAKIDIVEKKISLKPSFVPHTTAKAIMKTETSPDASETYTNPVEGHETQQNLSPKPLKNCKPEVVGLCNVHYTRGKNPMHYDITCLPNDAVILVDSTNFACRLYDSSYKCLAVYKFTSLPRGVCLVDRSEVAVTLPSENKIQFLTVDRSIQPGKKINTSLSCHGIANLSKNDLVVSGIKSSILYWCIVSMDGLEKSLVKICPSFWHSVLAVNNSRTCIYVSHGKPGILYAYSVDGTLTFKYEHQLLDGACGVGVDREDNLYIVGQQSNNIHQVSPSGALLQVFSTGIPKHPDAICFTSTGEEFFLTAGTLKLVLKFKLQ
ncbi:hypothetical protein ACJMK2_005737 [Sinanodonta woodiana]|uniref:Uncharacterized protein n=1 Tax=Sinanodonta woodiana TaxID=1069815 RepID=A0ABD3VUI6_SINWO